MANKLKKAVTSQKTDEKSTEKVIEKLVSKETTFEQAIEIVKKGLKEDQEKYLAFKSKIKEALYLGVRVSNIPLSQEKLNVLASNSAERFMKNFIK